MEKTKKVWLIQSYSKKIPIVMISCTVFNSLRCFKINSLFFILYRVSEVKLEAKNRLKMSAQFRLIIEISDIIGPSGTLHNSSRSFLNFSFYFSALTNSFVHVPFFRNNISLCNHYFKLFNTVLSIVALCSVAIIHYRQDDKS